MKTVAVAFIILIGWGIMIDSLLQSQKMDLCKLDNVACSFSTVSR